MKGATGRFYFVKGALLMPEYFNFIVLYIVLFTHVQFSHSFSWKKIITRN